MSENVTVGQAFKQAMAEEMERDDRVFVMGTDLFRRGGHFGEVLGLGPQFGRERVRDTPISESAMMLAGVGAALNGMRPVVDLNFIDFSLSAMDEIVNQAAKTRYMWGMPMPLVIRGSSGIAGYAAQHNNSLEASFAHAPGLVVVEPATPADTKGILKSALRGDDPVVFFMHKKLGGVRGPVGGPEDLVPLGKAVVRRTGRDATIITFGLMVSRSLQAAETLAADGIDVEVIDLRTIVPLDLELIETSVRKTGRAVVVAEETHRFGVAAEVATSIQETIFDYLDAPVLRVTQPHSPIPHSPPLVEALTPQVQDIEQAIRRSLAEWPSAE
jgi:acetoin:2,6-dichlorophenolindophenol oxidoreductase subunit beta